MANNYQFDVLIIGSGAAGLMSAIQLSEKLSIAVIAKDKVLEGSSYYSATKASSDLLVLAAHRTFGLPYIITRTCNNYGSHQHKEKFLPTIIRSIKEYTPFFWKEILFLVILILLVFFIVKKYRKNNQS